MSKRQAFINEWDRAFSCVCAMSMSDIDPEYRKLALDALWAARKEVEHGLRRRQAEREREDEARIVKAYREGRLVEASQ